MDAQKLATSEMRSEAFLTNPRTLVWALIIPSGLIAIASCGLIPWLLETRSRLDNSYWENQLLFATLSLVSICLALPALLLRGFGSGNQISTIAWSMTMIAYGILTIFTIQSHFTPFLKLLIAPCCLSLIAISYMGWKIERTIRDRTTQGSFAFGIFIKWNLEKRDQEKLIER